MKLRYDAATDILHIDLAGKGGGTSESSPTGVSVLVDDVGVPVGITIERASSVVDLASIEAVGLGGSTHTRVSSTIRVNVTSRGSGIAADDEQPTG